MPCTCGDNWTATLNKMPPGPATLSVKGTADCRLGETNPKLVPVHGHLVPGELLLKLICDEPVQSGGAQSNAILVLDVTYTQSPSPDYTAVVISNCDDKVIPIEVLE